MALGVIAIVIGAVFVFQGFSKNNLITERMKVEKVSLALDPNDPKTLTQIQNGEQAQAAADIISAHRRALAPTYQDLLLLSGGRFDSTNPKHLTYAQAMNLENYLYLAVAAFGLVQVVLGAGAFMIVTGIALCLTGLVLPIYR
jgi:cytoplasmic iron level regulating protein YaaA (DUF328/UPF0246 family)